MVRWVVTCCSFTGFSRNCLYHSSRHEPHLPEGGLRVPQDEPSGILGLLGGKSLCSIAARRNSTAVHTQADASTDTSIHRRNSAAGSGFENRAAATATVVAPASSTISAVSSVMPAAATSTASGSRLFAQPASPPRSRSAPCSVSLGRGRKHRPDRKVIRRLIQNSRAPANRYPPNVPTIRSGPNSRRASPGDTSPASTCTPSNPSRSTRSARSSRIELHLSRRQRTPKNLRIRQQFRFRSSSCSGTPAA